VEYAVRKVEEVVAQLEEEAKRKAAGQR
jgi:hypothetical protein